MPHARNLYFTGRQAILERLHDTFTAEEATGLTLALTGLGGSGKTQIALEYAWRYRQEYHDVLWVQADTEANLDRDYGKIADQLRLPGRDPQKPDENRESVRKWLEEHNDYLLVLDNADTPTLLEKFLPLNPAGHILVTSRANNLDGLNISRPVKLPVMSPDEALDFLLKRAERETYSPAERKAAQSLAAELGYLPLALEQAGAYIAKNEERFQDYLKSYRTLHLELLDELGPAKKSYPETVRTTWTKSFKAVKEASEAAADLLSISAFLSPDAIPYDLLIYGASEMGESLAVTLANAEEDPRSLNKLLTLLTEYSLIRRDSEARSYDIHRLVQTVIRNGMDDATWRDYAERTVRAVSQFFLLNQYLIGLGYVDISAYKALLPHALVCERWIKEAEMETAEAAGLLMAAGNFLQMCGQQVTAEPLFLHACTLWEKLPDLEPNARSLLIANTLTGLATSYMMQSRYAEAEPKLREAISLLDSMPDAAPAMLALDIIQLAGVYLFQEQYEEAEPLVQRAMTMAEEALKPEDPETMLVLSRLAEICLQQGKYVEAETLLLRALTLAKETLEQEHPYMVLILSNLAQFYSLAVFHPDFQNRVAEAEIRLHEILTTAEAVLGADHFSVGAIRSALGNLYLNLGRSEEAEPLLQQALTIVEAAVGPESAIAAGVGYSLGYAYLSLERTQEAEHLLRRVLAVQERLLGPEHSVTATTYITLASLLARQGNVEEAESFMQRAKAVWEKAMNTESPFAASINNAIGVLMDTSGNNPLAASLREQAIMLWGNAPGLENMQTADSLYFQAQVYLKQGDDAEAQTRLEQALALAEATPDTDPASTARILYSLASLYTKQGQYDKAEPLFLRELEMEEKRLGPEHADVLASLNNLISFYLAQQRPVQVLPFYQRALAIQEKLLGAEHPDVEGRRLLVQLYYVAALTYFDQGDYGQAEPFYQQALVLGDQMLGPEDSDMAVVLKSYALLLRATNREAEAEAMTAHAEAIEKQACRTHAAGLIETN